MLMRVIRARGSTNEFILLLCLHSLVPFIITSKSRLLSSLDRLVFPLGSCCRNTVLPYIQSIHWIGLFCLRQNKCMGKPARYERNFPPNRVAHYH